MPLPSTRVIPAGWSGHHRPVVEGTLTSAGTITRKAATGTTRPDGTYVPPATVTIYDGPLRMVKDTEDERHPVTGEKRLTTRRYEVQLLADAAEVFVNDVLTITAASAENQRLVGRRLRVESARVASEEWSRNLIVIEFEEG